MKVSACLLIVSICLVTVLTCLLAFSPCLLAVSTCLLASPLGAAGGEVMRRWLRRVSGEHASLSGSLPLAWTSSIFLAADPSRLDLLRSAAFHCNLLPFKAALCYVCLPFAAMVCDNGGAAGRWCGSHRICWQQTPLALTCSGQQADGVDHIEFVCNMPQSI